jgi:hypothetical protein
MLRWIVIFLVLANGSYFAWSRGYLGPLGVAPVVQTEPERLKNQIQPELIGVLSAPETQRSLEAVAAASVTECLQTPLLDDAQAEAVRGALVGLPDGSWAMQAIDTPGSWLVYMGPYSGADAVQKKKIELDRINVSYEEPQSTNLANGLSLGTYGSKAEATQARSQLINRGARTARVVQERAPVQGQVLRLPAVNAELRSQLGALATVLASTDLRPCSP